MTTLDNKLYLCATGALTDMLHSDSHAFLAAQQGVKLPNMRRFSAAHALTDTGDIKEQVVALFGVFYPLLAAHDSFALDVLLASGRAKDMSLLDVAKTGNSDGHTLLVSTHAWSWLLSNNQLLTHFEPTTDKRLAATGTLGYFTGPTPPPRRTRILTDAFRHPHAQYLRDTAYLLDGLIHFHTVLHLDGTHVHIDFHY